MNVDKSQTELWSAPARKSGVWGRYVMTQASKLHGEMFFTFHYSLSFKKETEGMFQTDFS